MDLEEEHHDLEIKHTQLKKHRKDTKNQTQYVLCILNEQPTPRYSYLQVNLKLDVKVWSGLNWLTTSPKTKNSVISVMKIRSKRRMQHNAC
jgi:hypothetical protein